MAVSFTGGASGPVIIGNDATTQTLFSVENGIASRVNLIIRELHVSLDATVALAAVMPLVRTSRATSISGGITLPKASFSTAQTSDAAVVMRCAMGEGAPIAATATSTVYQEFRARAHTAVEQMCEFTGTGDLVDYGCLPPVLLSKDFILKPGQSLIVQAIAAAATSNPAIGNNWFAQCAWEEDEIATFAISGTVTLSGSPVAGAIVTVVEADDVDMTNAVLRQTIVTGAGGTWASSIRTGKVGAAFVQYRVGATYYTAPGSPYLA
jgi:hypothetical protein